VGNIPLYLNEWGVDFACWCNYKYVNGGPGTIASIYIHDRYLKKDPPCQNLLGWYGCEQKVRVSFAKGFVPLPGAKRFQISNPSPILLNSLRASLEIFPPIEEVRKVSLGLTERCRKKLSEDLLRKNQVRIVTPKEKEASGAQLSFYFEQSNASDYNKKLRDKKVNPLDISNYKVFGDLRGAHIIRITFCALYNTEEEVDQFCQLFNELLNE
jgi:kynureninase